MWERAVLVRIWKEGNVYTLLVGVYIGTVTMENSMEISLKIKNRTTIRYKYVMSEYLCKEYKNTKKIYASPMFRWMDKEDVIYMQWITAQPWKRKVEIFQFATAWTDLAGIILSEINQMKKGKGKWHMISFRCEIETAKKKKKAKQN